MFPKPPRPEPPRRAQVMQVVQQKATQPVPTVLIVPAEPPAAPEKEHEPPKD